jgi:hypothetical protein
MQHGSPIHSLAHQDLTPYESLQTQNLVVSETRILTRIIIIYGYDYDKLIQLKQQQQQKSLYISSTP